MENTVRTAIVGVGNIGRAHVDTLLNTPSAKLVGVCDQNAERAEAAAVHAGAECSAFTDYETMMDTAAPEAVIVATPHYQHVPVSIAAAERGLHLLVEKPLAVHGADARRICEAVRIARETKPELVFAVMLNQRTYGHWRKIKDLIDSAELGRLVRATWIITDWFRTQHYYSTGGWRATWAGEGGGVLLNQCPHNLDLYQWFFGMPKRVTGHAGFGKYHDIEVEDEVTAFFEHENGMVGHFITSTGESPGTNRLEIVGEHGRLTFENDEIRFLRNRTSMLDFLKQSKESFTTVESWPCSVPYTHHGEPGHRQIIEAFLAAIRTGAELYAHGEEALNSVLLGNAIMTSAMTEEKKKTVTIPFDESEYEQMLLRLADQSRYDPNAVQNAGEVEDLSASF